MDVARIIREAIALLRKKKMQDTTHECQHEWLVTREGGFCGVCGLDCSQDHGGWVLYRMERLKGARYAEQQEEADEGS